MDLGGHQKELQRCASITYTTMSLDEERCLGCVYIYPYETADADVLMWVRKEEYEALEGDVFNRVGRWIAAEWPLEDVRHPVREG